MNRKFDDQSPSPAQRLVELDGGEKLIEMNLRERVLRGEIEVAVPGAVHSNWPGPLGSADWRPSRPLRTRLPRAFENRVRGPVHRGQPMRRILPGRRGGLWTDIAGGPHPTRRAPGALALGAAPPSKSGPASSAAASHAFAPPAVSMDNSGETRPNKPVSVNCG